MIQERIAEWLGVSRSPMSIDVKVGDAAAVVVEPFTAERLFVAE